MSKYKIKTLALLSAIPFLFSACTLQDLPVIGSLFGGVVAPPSEITLWGLWEKESTLAPILAMFQEEFPGVGLRYEDMSVLQLTHLVEYKNRVFARMEQSTWDADMVLVHNSWVPRLVKGGFLEPMPSRLMTPAKYSELFYPVAAESAIIEGEVYAVPAYYDGLLLLYNKSHFEEIGQTTPPLAWEEFRRVALDLTVLSEEGNRSEVLRGGAAIGAADNIDHFSDILGLMWVQAGVEIPEGIDSVPAQDALSFYTSLMKDHKIWRNDFPEATTAFINEQVSMIIVPSWQIHSILEAAPGLRIGAAPVPQALVDDPVVWGSFWMYVVPKNSDAKDVAWEFLNILTTEEGENALFAAAGRERAFGSAHALVSLSQSLAKHEYLGPLVNTAHLAKSAETAGRAGNRAQEEGLKDAINAVLNDDLTPEEALKEAKEKLSF